MLRRSLVNVSRAAVRGPMASAPLARGFATKAKFEFERKFKGHKITPPENHMESTKEELTDMLKTAHYYRRFELACDDLYKERQIRGFLHLYDGQEAVVIGMEAAIKKSDSVITAYRDHCHQLGRGDTGGSVMAELMGKSTGCSKGKGGSMHLYYTKNNFFGGNGIVGAQVPVGAGLAFAHKYKQDGGVAVAFYGDGAANQGQIFEAANMAALWKLPLIFVCENNHYGMGTASARAAANNKFYTRLDFVPGLWVDGMDTLAVKKAFSFAADHCRAGNGPIVIEADTYRYHGHSMSDPGIAYRAKAEVDQVRREADPILVIEKRLLSQNWITKEEITKIEKEARAQVKIDVDFATNSPTPPLAELCIDIYNGAPPPFIRMPDPTGSWEYNAEGQRTK